MHVNDALTPRHRINGRCGVLERMKRTGMRVEARGITPIDADSQRVEGQNGVSRKSPDMTAVKTDFSAVHRPFPIHSSTDPLIHWRYGPHGLIDAKTFTWKPLTRGLTAEANMHHLWLCCSTVNLEHAIFIS
jgi:hypothetical protein